MKKVILSANASCKVGGQGLNLHHFVEAYRAENRVTVYSRANIEGVESRRMSPSRIVRLMSRVPLLRRRRQLLSYLEDSHFDEQVASALPRSGADLFQGVVGHCRWSLEAAARAGMRTILDVVNTHVDDLDEQTRRECAIFGMQTFLHPEQKKRIHESYRMADAIRVMSHYAKSTFTERGFPADKLVVIAPPVELEQFRPAPLDSPGFRVAFAGLIEPWKGFHYLVDAFRKIDAADAELVFWGGPGARPISNYFRAVMAADPRISFRAVEIRSFGYDRTYGTCHVLVHPSVTDGFGYVVLEAMASGLPVIVSRSAGAAQLVVDGENGFLVPPRDAAAIADRLELLRRSPERLRAMGRKARETASLATLARFREQLPSLL